MGYHPKIVMTLHKLKTGERDWTFFYARNPDNIIDLIEDYRKKATTRTLTDPSLQSCFSRNPTLEDVVEVKMGSIIYIPTRLDQPNLILEEFQVSDEFVVSMPKGAVDLFKKHVNHSLSEKRGDLYKLKLGGVFPSQNYLPEDIIKAMVNCDYENVGSDETMFY
jgi:hypothetical protein